MGGARQVPLAVRGTGPISAMAGSWDELTGLTPASVVPEPTREPRLVSGLPQASAQPSWAGASSKRLVRIVLLEIRDLPVCLDRTTAFSGREVVPVPVEVAVAVPA